jgi:hypothetical protein
MIKAQKVDWLNTAWRLAAILRELPDWPAGLLAPQPGVAPPLTDLQKRGLELCQDQISLHLVYRLNVAHKKEMPAVPGYLFVAEHRDPDKLDHLYKTVEELCPTLTPAEKYAMDAQIMLGRVLQDRFVSPKWKQVLPLTVASIGGKSASAVGQASGSRERNRQESALRKDLREEVGRDSSRTWKEYLVGLESEGRVISWDAAEIEPIQWRDDDDTVVSTPISTFMKWLHQLRNS